MTTVLDGGVAFLDGGSSFLQRLIKLQGKVRRVIGVDIDDSIFEHPFLDERYIVEENAGLPLGDETVDLITAHWVFEHIRDPDRLADGHLEKFLSPSRRESDSVTASGHGRMERADHGAEGFFRC